MERNVRVGVTVRGVTTTVEGEYWPSKCATVEDIYNDVDLGGGFDVSKVMLGDTDISDLLTDELIQEIADKAFEIKQEARYPGLNKMLGRAW